MSWKDVRERTIQAPGVNVNAQTLWEAGCTFLKSKGGVPPHERNNPGEIKSTQSRSACAPTFTLLTTVKTQIEPHACQGRMHSYGLHTQHCETNIHTGGEILQCAAVKRTEVHHVREINQAPKDQCRFSLLWTLNSIFKSNLQED